MASPSPPQRLSASTVAAYRALRRSLRASDIEDRGLVSALSAEFRRLLLRGEEEEEEQRKRKKKKERGTAEAGRAATTSTSTATASTASPAAALASDFAFLLSAVKNQRDLLLSYDIGVDRETRQMETVRRTAARVGLRLPSSHDGSPSSEAKEEGEGGAAGR